MLLLSSSLHAGNTEYITDKLYAPVRSEQGEKGKLVNNGLESGTAVTVLEKNDQSGYAKIRTNNNIEGWVRLQYLSEEPVAAVLLEQANAQIAQLQEKNSKQEEELIAVRQISTSQIDTHERNAELVKQTQLLISENEVLKTDNDRLKSRNNQTWFFYGGALVAISSLISVLIPRLTKKRRNDGWA
jgi:SH3 domain protein